MKRALLVGIDHYPTVGSLTGCVADATALSHPLARHADGSPNWRTELITGKAGSATITRHRLRGALAALFANARDADLLFFFAGHGAQTLWGADLVTQDAAQNSLGVSMNDLVTLANDSPARSVTILLDCCFSGDTGNTPGLQAAGVAENFRLNKAVVRENVTIMAASRGTEPSQEAGGHGAFTRVLLDGLEGGATDHRGNVTALSLYGYVSPAFDAWEQRPVLKTYLTEPVLLRIGPPWLDSELLRRLPDHFPSEDHRLQLSPAHEGEGRPLQRGNPGSVEQQEFDYVGRLRNANLVTTDERRDHYWVAMESGHVYLTPLGRYFWRLADKGLL
ncbi:caspase family protein [Modestobacter altitudinis]|uniref:caspase family protein n=1 Tax=Modestobacter altitudinis TaxID=2213158 RepID=UPI001486F307|nr:caspase family protein [Modestobacter altitudinis]